MDLHINTKFDIGQEVRFVYKEKWTDETCTPCDFCDGNGFFIYKNEKCKCPKCKGYRTKLNKKLRQKYYTDYNTWEVSSIKITVDKNSSPIIVYKLIANDAYYGLLKNTVDEKYLFNTYDEAQTYCDKQNSMQMKD